MSLIGSIIGEAAPIVGGLLGKKDSGPRPIPGARQQNRRALRRERARERRAHRYTAAQNAKSLHLSRKAFQNVKLQQTHGIRRRVADAKAAGLHPLFALGANVPGGSPQMFIPGQAPTGNSISEGSEFTSGGGRDYGFSDALADAGSAVGSYFTKQAAAAVQAKQIELQVRQAEAGIAVDEAQARLLDGQLKRIETEGMTNPLIPGPIEHYGKPLPSEIPTQVRPQEYFKVNRYWDPKRKRWVNDYAPRGEELGQFYNWLDDASRATKEFFFGGRPRGTRGRVREFRHRIHSSGYPIPKPRPYYMDAGR